MKTFGKIIVLFLSLYLFTGCGDSKEEHSHQKAELYYCPMHPEVRSDRPGACPICHMDLVLSTSPSAESDMAQENFILSKEDMLKANIISAPVTKNTVTEDISLTGKLEIPEQNVRIIAAKFSGRIEKLYFTQTGQNITAGDALFEVYSDELIRLFAELQSALSLNDSKLIESLKERLMLRGITPAQISEIGKMDKVPLTVRFYAPYSGIILEKNISDGSYISEGSQLYRVADLRMMWAVGDLFSGKSDVIRTGQKVSVELQRNSTVYTGTVSFISPVLDASTRAVKIRVELPNPNSALRANEFVSISIPGTTQTALFVPSTAVIRTGKEDIVWVQTGKTEFLPHEVLLGQKAGDSYAVLSGLEEGDRIVTNGVYLLDSESRLRNFTGMVKLTSTTPPPVPKISKPAVQEKAELIGKSDLKAFNTVCPLLGEEVSDKNPKVKYKGKIWGFCCPGCDEKFVSDPAKYSQNITPDGKKYLGIYED